MCTAIVTTSPQKYPGSYFVFIMHRAIPTMLWFCLSTTPFYCGE
jgi:hypothetical protein